MQNLTANHLPQMELLYSMTKQIKARIIFRRRHSTADTFNFSAAVGSHFPNFPAGLSLDHTIVYFL
jgi:hypothetical protein